MDLLIGTILFLAVWAVLNTIVYFSSGLYKLKENYSFSKENPGNMLRFHGFSFGSFMTFGVTPKDLYLRVNFPFSLNFKYIKVPRNELDLLGVIDRTNILTNNLVRFRAVNLERLLPTNVIEALKH